MCIPSSKIVISSISSSFFYKKMKTLPVATCSSLFLLANVKLSQNTSSAVNEMTTCKFNRNVLSIMFCLLFVSLVRLPYLIDTAPSGRQNFHPTQISFRLGRIVRVFVRFDFSLSFPLFLTPYISFSLSNSDAPFRVVSSRNETHYSLCVCVAFLLKKLLL